MYLTVSKIRVLAQLSRGEHGFVVSMSTLFLTVMLGLGVLGGLVVVPDHLVQELSDFGVALDNTEQSFYYQIQVCDDCIIPAEYLDDLATLQDSAVTLPACLGIDVFLGEECRAVPTPSGIFS
jgi:hypothetical protein